MSQSDKVDESEVLAALRSFGSGHKLGPAYDYEDLCAVVERVVAARSAKSAVVRSEDEALMGVIDKFGLHWNPTQPAGSPDAPYFIALRLEGHGSTTCYGATPREAARRALLWLQRRGAAPVTPSHEGTSEQPVAWMCMADFVDKERRITEDPDVAAMWGKSLKVVPLYARSATLRSELDALALREAMKEFPRDMQSVGLLVSLKAAVRKYLECTRIYKIAHDGRTYCAECNREIVPPERTAKP